MSQLADQLARFTRSEIDAVVVTNPTIVDSDTSEVFPGDFNALPPAASFKPERDYLRLEERALRCWRNELPCPNALHGIARRSDFLQRYIDLFIDEV